MTVETDGLILSFLLDCNALTLAQQLIFNRVWKDFFLYVSPSMPRMFALNLFLLFLSSQELHLLFQVLLIFCSLLQFFFNFILFPHFPITHFITSASLFPTICDFFILIVSPSHLVPGWHLFTSQCSPFNHYCFWHV